MIYLTVALGGQAIFSHLQQKKRKLQSDNLEDMKFKTELSTVSVQIKQQKDEKNSNYSKTNNNNKLQVQDSDWSESSDWFVQSHDSVRRRRLSRSKLMLQEDSALLRDKNQQSMRDLPKYGGVNQNVTQIKIDYQKPPPESVKIGQEEDEKCRKNSVRSRKESIQKREEPATGRHKIDDGKIGEPTTMTIERGKSHEQNSSFVNRAFDTTNVSMKNLELSNEPAHGIKLNKMNNNNNNNDNNLNHNNQQDYKIINNNNNNNNDIDRQYMYQETKQAINDKSDLNLSRCLPDMINFPPPKQSSFSFDQDDEHLNGDDSSLSFNEWDDLLAHINPIYMREWSDSSLIRKIITIIRAPLLFAALCTVPIVDHDKKRSNWCRLLNIFHCISIPLVILISHRISLNSDTNSVGSMKHISDGDNSDNLQDLGSFVMQYYPIGLFAIGSLVALFMFKTTESEKPPKYHVLFAYVGFIMSILWVYTLVTEILGLLKTIGIVFSMSDTTIGLAFLAWGNSLGDIVANLALAEAGYPRMAIGACIGAPLLNLLIGFGLSFAVNLSPGEVVSIEYTPTISLLCLSLAIVIISLMFCTLIPPNYSKRPFGYILMTAYFTYFVLAIALEFELITFD